MGMFVNGGVDIDRNLYDMKRKGTKVCLLSSINVSGAQNGGLELGNWLGWDDIDKAAIVENPTHSGSYSIKMTIPGDDWGYAYWGHSPIVPVPYFPPLRTVGKTYRATVWYRVSGGDVNTIVYFDLGAGDGKIRLTPDPYEEITNPTRDTWLKWEAEFVEERTGNEWWFGVGGMTFLGSPCLIYIDDLGMVEA